MGMGVNDSGNDSMSLQIDKNRVPGRGTENRIIRTNGWKPFPTNRKRLGNAKMPVNSENFSIIVYEVGRRLPRGRLSAPSYDIQHG